MLKSRSRRSSRSCVERSWLRAGPGPTDSATPSATVKSAHGRSGRRNILGGLVPERKRRGRVGEGKTRRRCGMSHASAPANTVGFGQKEGAEANCTGKNWTNPPAMGRAGSLVGSSLIHDRDAAAVLRIGLLVG